MLMGNKHPIKLLGACAHLLHALHQLATADANINQKALAISANQSSIPLAAAGQHHNLNILCQNWHTPITKRLYYNREI